MQKHLSNKKINVNNIKEISVKDFLLKLFFFFCLIPFISPFPLKTDVQPIFAFVGFVTLFYIVTVENIKVNKFTLLLILYACFFLLNYNLDEYIDPIFHLRKSVGLLLSIPILLICSKYFNILNNKLILSVLGIYLLGAIIQIFIPNIYYGIFSNFFNNKVVELGVRGWKSFSAEPINLAFTCLAIMCITIANNNISIINNKNKKKIIYICIFLIIGSLNATGLFSLLIFAAIPMLSKFNLKNIVLLLILVITPTIIFHDFLYEEIRTYKLLIELFTNPLLLIENSSLFYRVFHNIVAILYFFDQPSMFGLGVGTFDIAAKHVVELHNLANHFTFRAEFITSGYYATFGYESKNIFSQLIIEHGFIGVFFYITCISYIILKWTKGVSVYILLYFIISTIQSTPMIFPLIWVLLIGNAYVYNYNKSK